MTSHESGRSSESGRSGAVETPGKLKETERIVAGPGPGRNPFGGGMIGQKASTFKPSAKRLLARMRPQRTKLGAVLTLTVVSVLLSAVGPRILGKATDLIFAGLIGGRLEDGVTKAEAVQALRDEGNDKVANLVASLDLVPGRSVDFDAVAEVLLLVLGIYVLGSVLACNLLLIGV
jgi:ATP-binding cassette subfamily B protein